MKRMMVVAGMVFLCFTALHATAQSLGPDYQTAIGIKFGWWSGGSISIKHFIKDNVAIEGEASFWEYGGDITGLYEWYGDIPAVEGMKWYAGAGAHIGFYNTEYAHYYPGRSNGLYLGPDGVLGVDYKFNNAPINLSFDVQPRVDLPGGFFDIWGGLGVRFAF
jgi:hypothetical protein